MHANFCAFECKLLEFQQLFLLSCAAHPNCSFLLFNGGRLLNEIIHATIAFGGLSHCSWKRGKIIVQFLTALMRLRRVLSNLLWLNSCELITHRILSLPRCQQLTTSNKLGLVWIVCESDRNERRKTLTYNTGPRSFKMVKETTFLVIRKQQHD